MTRYNNKKKSYETMDPSNLIYNIERGCSTLCCGIYSNDYTTPEAEEDVYHDHIHPTDWQ